MLDDLSYRILKFLSHKESFETDALETLFNCSGKDLDLLFEKKFIKFTNRQQINTANGYFLIDFISVAICPSGKAALESYEDEHLKIEILKDERNLSKHANAIAENANTLSEKANLIAENANALSGKANALSRKANALAKFAIVISIIAIVILAIALFR